MPNVDVCLKTKSIVRITVEEAYFLLTGLIGF
jgi:hypothetical protein